jgi:hypothetical protein
MRFVFIFAMCLVVPLCGCGPQPSSVGFQPGDVCESELVFAPEHPWTGGTKVSIGMLVKRTRQNGDMDYVADSEIVPEQATMKLRITYYSSIRRLGQPIEVPLVRDC